MLMTIVDTDPDPGEAEETLVRLRRELLDHSGVADARTLSRVPPPAGSKAVDGLVAALSVAITHPDVLATVLEAVQGWVGRLGRAVRVEIDGDVLDLGRATSAQQQQIVDAWVRRHGTGE